VNVLHAKRMASDARCPRVEGRARIQAAFAGYLTDESHSTAPGVEVIFFPENLGHVCSALEECGRKGMSVTVAGARTGIVGGAVPIGSPAVLALERLDHIRSIRYDEGRNAFFARVEAGVILADFQRVLRATPARELPWADASSREAGVRAIQAAGRRLFYPVDPTETSAQIGGTVATNASGARTFHYGPTRRWVEAVTVVLACGQVLRFRRGEVTACEGRFVLQCEGRGEQVIPIPRLELPPTKHAAGYYLRPHMDAVDLFVGSEGTLGVITEVELRLAPEPPERLFITAFLPSEDDALGFVQDARDAEELRLLAIEYIGPNALDLLRQKRSEEGASSGVPPLSEEARCAVYLEVEFEGDEELRRSHGVLNALLRRFGTSARATWAGFWASDLDAMKAFRHALPEQVNSIIGRLKLEVPPLHKVGTDMAVPDERLGDVITLYRSRLDASGLQYVVFGHIGDNHLHVNILPRSEQELAQAMALYEEFAREVVAMRGSVSAEHGIGRLKRALLPIQFGPDKVAQMRALKAALDPGWLLNPGVLF